MPSPTSTTAVQRPDLGMLAYQYAMNAASRGFIGLRLLPLMPVGLQSADYPTIPLEAVLKIPKTARAPKAAYARDDWQWGTNTYSCQEHGLEGPLADDERRKFEGIYSALDQEAVTVNRLQDKLLRAQEQDIANMLFNVNNFTAHAVANKWSAAADATPRADVQAGIKAVRNASGLLPNALAISWTTFQNIINTAEFANYTKYTTPVALMPFDAQINLVAMYLGVPELLVGDAVHDGAKKGQNASVAGLWGDAYGLLCRIATNAMDLEEPCLGRTFLWTQDSPENVVIEQYREEQTRSDIFRVRHNTDECFVYKGCAYLLSNLA